MRVALRIVMGGCLFLLSGGPAGLQAEEKAAAHAAEGGSETALSDDQFAPVDALETAGGDNRGRYKQHDGRWWYLLPSNRWVTWTDGRWIDPPTYAIESDHVESPQYQNGPHYIVPAPSPAARLLQPRPRSWYYTGRVYDGPYYYYDEFYEPYGGARPYPYYPEPHPVRRPSKAAEIQ